MNHLLRALIALLLLSACAAPATDGPDPDGSPALDPSPAVSPSPSPSPSSDPSPTPAPVPTALDGAEATGRSLAAAEAAIRSGDTPAGRLAEYARVQQAAYRTLVANSQWRAEALAQLPAELVGAAEANITAGAELRALTRPQPELPPWRIIEPPPAEELLGYYRQAEAEFGVRWEYLAAIHLVETRMGRIRGTSTAGAQGPMQFIPPTWAAYGQGDINDPLDAIRAAARYLKASGAPGNMDRALHAYNPTPRYVTAISIYADQMMQDERTYLGYYHWQVFYRTTGGDVELPVGYGE